MNNKITLSQTLYVLIFLAMLQFILQVSLLTKGVDFIVTHLTIDDTYYYLQTAWNTKHLGFVTFDGLHTTNGVQLLWFGIAILFALLAPTKTVLLLTALVASFLLNALCYLVIWKVGEVLKRPTLALFMASLWLMQSFSVRTYSMGMENSLHAFIFWGVIWQATLFLVRVKNRQQPNFLGLTILLILNAWTRLDSALFSATLYIYCIAMLAYSTRGFRLFWQEYARSIIGSSLLAGLGLVIQLTTFQLMDGAFLPVSGRIKSSEASWGWGIESLRKLVDALILSTPQLLPDSAPSIVLGLLGLMGVLIIVGLHFVRSYKYSIELEAFRNLWYGLLIALVLYHIIVVGYGITYEPYFVWYRSPMFIFWIITFALAANMIQDVIMANNFKYIFRWALVGLSLLIIATAGARFAKRHIFAPRADPFQYIKYYAAIWISENTPPDVVYAAWNAGEFGYFSNRTVINLDGLINSNDYYERVLQGSFPLKEYLYENNVDYIVDYGGWPEEGDELISSLPVAHTFRRYRGQRVQIWQVPPLGSSKLEEQ